MLETHVGMKQKQVSNLKLDASKIEAVKQLKGWLDLETKQVKHYITVKEYSVFIFASVTVDIEITNIVIHSYQ